MKNTILAATFLTAASLAMSSANALEVTVGGDAGVDVTIGNDVNVGVDAGVDAGAAVGGNAGAEAGAGAGAAAGAAVDANVNANATTQVHLRTTDDTTVMVEGDTLLNLAVFTADDVQIGTVTDVDLNAEGGAVVIVELTDGWVDGATRVAIRADVLLQTSQGLELDTDEESLHAQIMAGLTAKAAGGAAVNP